MKYNKTTARLRRHRKIRQRSKGSKECPRFCVYKSNRHLFVQMVDDLTGKSLLSCSDVEIKKKKKIKIVKSTNVKEAEEVGRLAAEKALKIGIKKVVFDRGGFKYHGLIKAVAVGARAAGLSF